MRDDDVPGRHHHPDRKPFAEYTLEELKTRLAEALVRIAGEVADLTGRKLECGGIVPQMEFAERSHRIARLRAYKSMLDAELRRRKATARRRVDPGRAGEALRKIAVLTAEVGDDKVRLRIMSNVVDATRALGFGDDAEHVTKAPEVKS